MMNSSPAIEVLDSSKNAIFVEYEKLNSSGSPTGIESSILTKLTTRGFPLLSYGTSESKDPSIAYLTLLLGKCESSRLSNAVQQLGNIIGVTRAELRDIDLVTQELRAVVHGLSGEEAKTIRSGLGANLQRTAIFEDIPERSVRTVTRNLAKLQAKICKATKERDPEAKNRQTSRVRLKIRMENPPPAVTLRTEELGGEFRDKDYISLNADVIHIDRLAEYLRQTVSEKLESLTISAPKTYMRRTEKQ